MIQQYYLLMEKKTIDKVQSLAMTDEAMERHPRFNAISGTNPDHTLAALIGTMP